MIFATWSFILQEGRFDLLESDQIYQASPFVFPQFLFVFYHFLKISGIFIFPSGISELHRGFSQHFISSKGSCAAPSGVVDVPIFSISREERNLPKQAQRCGPWGPWAMSMLLRHVTCGPCGHGKGEVLSVAQSGRFQR